MAGAVELRSASLTCLFAGEADGGGVLAVLAMNVKDEALPVVKTKGPWGRFGERAQACYSSWEIRKSQTSSLISRREISRFSPDVFLQEFFSYETEALAHLAHSTSGITTLNSGVKRFCCQTFDVCAHFEQEYYMLDVVQKWKAICKRCRKTLTVSSGQGTGHLKSHVENHLKKKGDAALRQS